jgi:dsDNA-specific endonuclease/ATPase MutS2
MIPINKQVRNIVDNLRDTFTAIDEANGLENHRNELAQQVEALKGQLTELQGDLDRRRAESEKDADAILSKAKSEALAILVNANEKVASARIEAEKIVKQAHDTAASEATRALDAAQKADAAAAILDSLNASIAEKTAGAEALEKRIADARAALKAINRIAEGEP